MKTIDTKTFFRLVWPNTLLRYETLELRARLRRENKIQRSFHTSVEDFLQKANSYGKGWDIYFGVATRFQNSGKKKDCFRVKSVWIDLDTDTLPDFPKKIQPDVVVNSGKGFHVYWILQEPVYLRTGKWKEIEAVNRALVKEFKGDIGSLDVSRILRVPGFNNFKYDPSLPVRAYVQD